jgi:hypothetical protein
MGHSDPHAIPAAGPTGETQVTHALDRRNLSALVALLAAFGTVAAARPALAHRLKAPSVPAAIAVPAGNKPFLIGHAVGSQNYVCLPTAAGYAWTLFTPEAMLTLDDGRQLATHFFSPNPAENDAFRATWLHSRDSSRVWGKASATSLDPNFVAPNSIPWVLLAVVGSEAGPLGGDTMTRATYVQRIETAGGVAPADGCAAAADVGKKAIEPYSADYVFFAAEGGNVGDDD